MLKNNIDDNEIIRHTAMAIYAIYFNATDYISPLRIKNTLNIPDQIFARAWELFKSIIENHSPLFLQEVEGEYRLKSKKEFAEYIKKINRPTAITLTETQREVLAIIAYKQPIKKKEIDELRGVDSEKTLEWLREKKLIKRIGELKNPGSPVLYQTTKEFLDHFGLKSLSDLPPINIKEEESFIRKKK